MRFARLDPLSPEDGVSPYRCGSGTTCGVRDGQDVPTLQLRHTDQRRHENTLNQLILSRLQLDQTPQDGEHVLEFLAPGGAPPVGPNVVQLTDGPARRRSRPAFQPTVEYVLSADLVIQHLLSHRPEDTLAEVEFETVGIVDETLGQFTPTDLPPVRDRRLRSRPDLPGPTGPPRNRVHVPLSEGRGPDHLPPEIQRLRPRCDVTGEWYADAVGGEFVVEAGAKPGGSFSRRPRHPPRPRRRRDRPASPAPTTAPPRLPWPPAPSSPSTNTSWSWSGSTLKSRTGLTRPPGCSQQPGGDARAGGEASAVRRTTSTRLHDRGARGKAPPRGGSSRSSRPTLSAPPSCPTGRPPKPNSPT